MMNSSPPKKPNKGKAALAPKPYTEYTIFFRLERAHILQSSGIIDEEIMSSLDPNHKDALEFPRPAKYQSVSLSPYWYSSAHKAAIEKKRKHRKRQGRLDLKTLSRTISASWRSADPVVVEYCRKLARSQLEKYNSTIENIIKKQEKKTKPAVGRPSELIRQQHYFESIPDGALSLKNFGPGLTEEPTVTPPPIGITMLEDNFINTAMGGGPIDNSKLFEMLQLQQEAQQANEKLNRFCNSSQAPEFSNSQKRKFVRRASAPPEFNMNFNGNMPIGNSNDISSMTNIMSSMGNDSSMGSNNMIPFMGSCNSNNDFLCADICNATKLRRRSSVTPFASHELQLSKEIFPGPTMFPEMCNSDAVFNIGQNINHEPQRRSQRRRSSLVSMASGEHEFSDSFKNELNNTSSFSCVPEWEKKDADKLLDILNDPQFDGPVISSDVPLELTTSTDQDMTPMLMGPDELEEWVNSICSVCT